MILPKRKSELPIECFRSTSFFTFSWPNTIVLENTNKIIDSMSRFRKVISLFRKLNSIGNSIPCQGPRAAGAAAGWSQIEAISGVLVRRVISDRQLAGFIEPPGGSCREIITPRADKQTRDARRVPRPSRLRPTPGEKMRPCARSFRLTREVTGRAGAEDDSAEAACRRA
jgi:hypothetical protein